MYAYIDESGNTGPNLFDVSQPNFLYGALITKSDFDKKFNDAFRKICKTSNVGELHAGELGIGRLEGMASHLLKILRKVGAKFHLCNIYKVDLAVMKLFDAYFDSGENLAIPPHIYNLRPLRLLMLLKFAYLLDEELVREFWGFFLLKNKKESQDGLDRVLREILRRVPSLPDEGSRQLVDGAINWAIRNPEAISTYSESKRARYSHLPNVMAFLELLNGIENYSKKWNREVIEIKHDRQDQFKTELKYWHSIFSHASDKEIPLFGRETLSLQKVKDSHFIISKDSDSPGLQMVDVVLWLFSRVNDHGQLPPQLTKLIRYCIKNTSYYELSIADCQNYLEVFFKELDNKPLSDEDLEKAKNDLKHAYEANDERLVLYAEEKFKKLRSR